MMGDRYSDSTWSILAASTDRDSLVVSTENLERLDRQGGGALRCPDQSPVADPDDLRAFLVHIEYPESDSSLPESALVELLFGFPDSEAGIERPVQAVIDGETLPDRKCKITGSQLIWEAFDVEAPAYVIVVGEPG
jgi:hypothetical protein